MPAESESAVGLGLGLRFNRQLGAMPGVPSPFQGIDLGKTFIEQFLRRTGTGRLVGSSTIEDQGFVFRIGTG